MKDSNIQIQVKLDEQNIPEKIFWQASDTGMKSFQEAKCLALSIWDEKENGTLKIDLWNKEMQVHEMKRFVIETLSGLADTIRKATNDEVMAIDMENLCKSLSQRLQQEMKDNQ